MGLKEMFAIGEQDVFSRPSIEGLRPRIDIERLKVALAKRIGLFGSTRGDTQTTGWRNDDFLPRLETLGVDTNAPGMSFNPVVDDWSEDDAIKEVMEFAKDRFLAFYIANNSNSVTSLIEVGVAEWGSMVRGQEVFVFIQDTEGSPLTDDAKRARELIETRVAAIQERFGDKIRIARNMQELAEQVAHAYLSADTRPITYPALGKTRPDLLQTILVSGTSGKTEPAYQSALKKVLKENMEGMWRANWDELEKVRESLLKASAAVKVHVITNNTASLGALTETVPMVMEAFLAGQKIIVVLEEGWNDPKQTFNIDRSEFASEADYIEKVKTARNSRTALVKHLERYLQENPKGVRLIISKNVAADASRIARLANGDLAELRRKSKKRDSRRH